MGEDRACEESSERTVILATATAIAACRRSSAATIISAWFGGTTLSSAPWKKMTGAENRSTALIGERST
jgi:hypothetical protein